MAKKIETLEKKTDRELLEIQVELQKKATKYLNNIDGYLLFYTLIIILGLIFWIGTIILG